MYLAPSVAMAIAATIYDKLQLGPIENCDTDLLQCMRNIVHLMPLCKTVTEFSTLDATIAAVGCMGSWP